MNWKIIGDNDIAWLASQMEQWPAIVIDCETTSLERYRGMGVLGIGLSSLETDCPIYYLPDPRGKLPLLIERKPLVGFNIKFDLHALTTIGIVLQQERFYDVIVMARLWAMDEHPNLDLKTQAKQILEYEYRRQDIIKKKNKLAELPAEDVAEYCCEDIWATRALYHWFKTHLDEKRLRLFSMESLLTRDLFDIEQYGLPIDKNYAGWLSDYLDKTLEEDLFRISQISGIENFNPRSVPTVRKLMETIGIESVAQAKKGASWNKDSLEAVSDKHPIARMLVRYNALKHLRTGIIQRCLDATQYEGGRLHGDYKNWGTVTGRLSSDMQQMTKGWLQIDSPKLYWDEEGPDKTVAVRRLFGPEEDYLLWSIDYRQIEMYILGFYMKDETFTNWLESEDVHAATAYDVWGIDSNHPEAKKYRARGKEFNFACVYGVGVATLQKHLGGSEEEIKALRKQYFTKMPGYWDLLNRVRTHLADRGYVSNMFGRRYELPEELAYKAVNWIIQGSAGDFVKFRLPATRKIRRELGIHICNTTHDDFLFHNLKNLSLNDMRKFIQILEQSPFNRTLPVDIFKSEISFADLEEIDLCQEKMVV